MNAVILIGVISVIASLLKYKNSDDGLKISFFIIFLLLGLRYNFGRDYEAYLQGFTNINKESISNIFAKSSHFEPGWILLCRIFKPIGFFGMTAFLALFNSIVYYRFTKKYVPNNYYWIAVFLYVFSEGLMLTLSSAMRQSLAINLFILSLIYIQDKSPVRYFICIGLASAFHTSALVLIPIYFLIYAKWRISTKLGIIIFAIYILLFMFGKSIMPGLNQFVNNYFSRYHDLAMAGELKLNSGIGLAFNSIIFILILSFEKYQDEDNSLLFKIASLNYIMISLSMALAMFGRIGMYFQPILIIAVIPLLILTIRYKKMKILFLFLILMFTTYNFIQFFNDPYIFKYYGTYHTIFSAASWQ